MNAPSSTQSNETRIDLLILHPTGSEAPLFTSLAIGILEWIRLALAQGHVTGMLWTQTVKVSDGNTSFLMRSVPWGGEEVRHKLHLIPTAEGTLHLALSGDNPPAAEFTLKDRRGDPLHRESFPFRAEEFYERLPRLLDAILTALSHTPITAEPGALFHTQDPPTILAGLFALERLVAFRAGVGTDDPGRFFEPALLCLDRDAAHPVGRHCLLRIGQSMLETNRAGEQQAALQAYERWSQIASLSPVPPFHLALARQRAGQPDSARGAFEESLRRDPLYGPALTHYALWLGERGFVDQGLAVLNGALGRANIDGALLDQAGCLLANAGRVREAEPFFRAAVRAGGSDTAPSNLARSLMAQGREEEALSHLQNCLAEHLDAAKIEILSEIGDGGGSAAARARALLRGIPLDAIDDPAGLRILMDAIARFDGAAAAGSRARRLLEVAPHSDHRRAAHLLLLEPEMPKILERWNQAAEQLTTDDFPFALEFFQEVARRQPGFGRARFLLAVCLERSGQSGQSLIHAEAAASTIEESADPEVLDFLAVARANAGNLAGAAQIHHRAASISPADPRILHNAAVSLLRAGYLHEGTSLANASLALNPDQPDLHELMRNAAEPRRRPGMGPVRAIADFVRKIVRPT